MTIAYALKNGLYLNITNRCTNNCVFCIREQYGGVGGHQLWLEHEPTLDDILSAVKDPSGFGEIVFCGYGEPTCRLETLIATARALKPFGVPIRLNTNGQADLIGGRDVWPELAGLLTGVSISLNAPTAGEYVQLCRPQFGAEAYEAMLTFARNAKKHIPEVMLTAVAYPGVDEAACRTVAESMGLPFRMRNFQGECANPGNGFSGNRLQRKILK